MEYLPRVGISRSVSGVVKVTGCSDGSCLPGPSSAFKLKALRSALPASADAAVYQVPTSLRSSGRCWCLLAITT